MFSFGSKSSSLCYICLRANQSYWDSIFSHWLIQWIKPWNHPKLSETCSLLSLKRPFKSLKDKNIYISFSFYLTYLILFNDVENITLPTEDWWLQSRKRYLNWSWEHNDWLLCCIYDDNTTGCSQPHQTMNNWCWNGGAKPVDKLASKTGNRLNWKLINSQQAVKERFGWGSMLAKDSTQYTLHYC